VTIDKPIVIAVDCDLRRVHAWCSSCGALGTKLGHVGFVLNHWHLHAALPVVTLFEIASPMSMAGNRVGGAAMATNVMKWAIFNAAQAMALELGNVTYCHEWPQRGNRVLVSPSSTWTRGYDVKTRHEIANAKAKNKDLRECQAMIHFFGTNPKDWVGLPTYLDEL
jgi:hypothetical protein